MSYYFAATMRSDSIDKASVRVKAALKEEGFGVLTEIDVQATLSEKIGVDFRPYRILGACNPKLALSALQAEDKIGTMLPCNVIIQETGEGQFEVAAVDPVASMQAIKNDALGETAAKVSAKLRAMIGALQL